MLRYDQRPYSFLNEAASILHISLLAIYNTIYLASLTLHPIYSQQY
ncbi:hypothetical protein A1OE_1252 [Candidatus Endolissoclinum faulkneri L2]|uniref:Uncharacterized protein n=1 Tax=Candidatus Endolissoclinum faulkneri L2 TaxID=1193729 RepID=K7ZDD3_9PROT|nr:hypothetical protein A1OE_1252 [Candidatus Endolissoclinum faulkneri L2]